MNRIREQTDKPIVVSMASVAADLTKRPMVYSLIAHAVLVSLFVFSFGQKPNINVPPTVLAIQARPVDARLIDRLPLRLGLG